MAQIAEEEFLDEVGEIRAQATPWTRLWARLLDLTIYLAPLSLLVGYLFPDFVMLPIFAGNGGSSLLGALLLPLAMVLDAGVISVFGNSPGKWLIGTRVETIRHERPDFGTALNRNFLLYLKGIGLGIPIIAIVQYFINFSKLRNGRQSSWDSDSNTRVYDINSHIVRTFVVAGAFLALNIGGALLNFLEEQEVRQAAAAPGWDPSRPRVDPIAIRLEEAATQVQPQQIDEITMLEGADAHGRILTYRYTITRRDTSDEQLIQFLNETMVPQVCNDGNMRAAMDNYGITYQYHYTLPSPAEPFLVEVTRARCAELPAG